MFVLAFEQLPIYWNPWHNYVPGVSFTTHEGYWYTADAGTTSALLSSTTPGTNGAVWVLET